MSISAMKQALEALEGLWDDGFGGVPESMHKDAITILRQAIAEAEKQEPVFYVIQATDRFGEGYEQTYWEDPNGFPVYAAPVHASDISQEHVDETAKREHEWVGLTDEEIYDYADKFLYQHGSNYGIKSFGKAIEAKLKEKNT